jgi:putative phage-type endonuclease
MGANDQFLLDRMAYIGGSDVAGILGISPWKTPLDIYMDKIAPTMGDDASKAKVFNRGKRMEPYVIDMLAEEQDLAIVARNRRFTDPQAPYLACEVDAEYLDPALGIQNIEIKTVSPYKAAEWGEQQTDAIPVHYTAQAMHGLMVTGRQVCVFGVLIGGDDFRVYRVQRDDDTIAAMRAKTTAFWAMVQAQTPPPPSTSGDILKMFQRDTGGDIEASAEVLEAYSTLKFTREKTKELESMQDVAYETIKLHMRDSSTLTLEGKPIATWKSQQSTRFDQSSFSAANPVLFEKFKAVTNNRVFRLK